MNHEITRLESLETELAVFFAGIGVMLDECFMPGAGVRALGFSDEPMGAARLVSQIDVKATHIGKLLPVWERYAYEGVVSAGYTLRDMEEADSDSPLEFLRDMLNLLGRDDPYFDLCLDAAEMYLPCQIQRGKLKEMADRVDARNSLDTGNRLTVSDLALLANMNERSVRNAIAAGELSVGELGYVSHEVAVRWLQGRRGFKATEFLAFPQDRGELPDSLNAVEIPKFVKTRLQQIWTPKDGVRPDDGWAGMSGHPDWIVAASKAGGFSMDRIMEMTRLPLSIKPKECEELAQLMSVDKVWLTYQLMAALFPDQIDMLMNPAAWSAKTPATSADATTLSIVLTDKMIAHGYIDLPMSAKSFFPDDSFGNRPGNEVGSEVNFVYGNHRASSDIRIKSSKTISPRKRFTSWLNTELAAQPGDRIRFEKSGQRNYTLHHLAGQA